MWIGKMWQEAIWSNLWNRIDDRGWCQDPIWGDMWIWTDDIRFYLDQIYILLCVLERLWHQVITTTLEYYIGYNGW
jgi:hypothetical protein